MKNVLVTGASRGIGWAIVNKFLELTNYKVNFFSSSLEKITLAKKELLSKGVESSNFNAFVADAYDPNFMSKIIDETNQFGIPDIIINNLGAFEINNIFEPELEKLDRLVHLNIYITVQITQLFLSSMLSKNFGHIINICSTASYMPLKNCSYYNVAKYGLYGWGKALRNELLKSSIKVTNVLPGLTLTDSTKDLNFDNTLLMQPEDIALLVVNATLLSKNTVVEDIFLRPQIGDF